MKRLIILATCIGAYTIGVLSQDKPNPNIAISCQEKTELLEAQVDKLAAMLAQNQSEKTVELKSFNVDQRVNALFTSYGFTRDDHVLCHGPSDAPECAGAPEHDIVFRKKVKTVKEAKEVKDLKK